MKSKNDIIEYVKTIFDSDINLQMVEYQIDRLTKDNHYTYDGIFYTLYYLNEIKGFNFAPQYGIKIIEMYYNEAKEYNQQVCKINEINKTKNYSKPKTRYETIETPTMQKYKSLKDIEIENFIKKMEGKNG